MKLATYKDDSRDGQLVVVSRDLASAHFAGAIAGRLQQVLDDWNFLSPQLEDLYSTLNHGKARHAFPFEPARCAAPLPRAFQWINGAAYPAHAARMRQAGAHDPAEPPLRCGDELLGPCDDVVFTDPAHGIDFGAGLAVITDDLPLGTSPERALEGVRLLLAANDWALRELPAADAAPGLAAWQAGPPSAFSPVAVTPDELADAWQGGRVHGALKTSRNGSLVGRCEAGAEMAPHFGELIAQLCRTRRLRAGAIVGGGIVSNEDAARGHGCIAERRAAETLESGAPRTAFMAAGDSVRIEMIGRDGSSVFGAIDQRVALR